MKKRIAAALLLLMVLTLSSTALGITWQEFTWNEYTLPMIRIETPETVGGFLTPSEGYYFIQVFMQLPIEIIEDDEIIEALDDATFLVTADGTEYDNSIRTTAAETGEYSCIFTVTNDMKLEDFEFVIHESVSVAIDEPVADAAVIEAPATEAPAVPAP